jgi:hypothetical protein
MSAWDSSLHEELDGSAGVNHLPPVPSGTPEKPNGGGEPWLTDPRFGGMSPRAAKLSWEAEQRQHHERPPKDRDDQQLSVVKVFETASSVN